MLLDEYDLNIVDLRLCELRREAAAALLADAVTDGSSRRRSLTEYLLSLARYTGLFAPGTRAGEATA